MLTKSRETLRNKVICTQNKTGMTTRTSADESTVLVDFHLMAQDLHILSLLYQTWTRIICVSAPCKYKLAFLSDLRSVCSSPHIHLGKKSRWCKKPRTGLDYELAQLTLQVSGE